MGLFVHHKDKRKLLKYKTAMGGYFKNSFW